VDCLDPDCLEHSACLDMGGADSEVFAGGEFKYFYARYVPDSKLSHEITDSQAGQIIAGDTLLMVLMARTDNISFSSPGWSLISQNLGIPRPSYNQNISIYMRTATGTAIDQTINFQLGESTPSIAQRLIASVLVFSGSAQVSDLESGVNTHFCSQAPMPSISSLRSTETPIYGYHTPFTTNYSPDVSSIPMTEQPQQISFFKSSGGTDSNLQLDETGEAMYNRMTLGVGIQGNNSSINYAHHDAGCWVDELGGQSFRFVVSPN